MMIPHTSRKVHTEAEKAEVFQLLDAKKSQGEVSRQTGVPQPTIARWMKEQRFNGAQVNSTPVTSSDTTTTITDTELSAHPLANLFPLMNEADFTALRDDIAGQGLLEPLWLYEGQILDGRNRYNACKALGIQPQVRTYQGNDPLGFVLSMNLVRRHLNESQRALVAADVATMRQGERTDLEPSANLQKVSQAKASALFNISTRSVSDAKRVKAEAQPEIIKAVRDGHLAVSAAAKLAAEPITIQREVTAKVVSGEAATVNQALKQVKGKESAAQPNLETDLQHLRRLWEQMLRRWHTEEAHRAILANLDNLAREIRQSLGLEEVGRE
jgi:Homeodomain-like domain